MNMNPFITCAVTGSGGTQDRSPHVPRSPEQIAASAIDAAKAGAAVVHCHVRDPETGRIRDSDTDVVVNLTAGMGGDMVFGDVENPLPLNEAGTDMAGATERVAHVAECLPEICTLDCGTMNFAEADYVMTNTPGMLRAMGQMMTDLGVRPEIEVFETGHLWFAKQLVEEGIILSCRWSTTRPPTGPFRRFPSAVTKCLSPRPRCSPAVTFASAWKTTCG
jgi:uncharacterized protein (DUF849 family)